ncbi:MAG: ATP-binding protein [Pseudomonadota bacterium]|nr:ATP-binding protein [Pseudomonadota bacterium]
MSDQAHEMNTEKRATSEEQWQHNNDAYLEAALQWLRVRLNRLAGAPPAQTPEPTPEPARGGFFRRRETEKPRLALPSADPYAAELEQARIALEKAESVEPPPALNILGSRLGLSRFEQEVLLLCASVELDTRIAGLCARAQQDPHLSYPTFVLALALFDDPAWDVLSPERPLRQWRLIEINQPGAQPLTTSPLRADERIVNYLKGLNYLDDRLTPLLVPFDVVPQHALPPSQDTACASVERTLRLTSGNGTQPVVQLVGIDPLSKQLVAQQAAHALNLNLYRLPAALLPRQTAELETLARLWQRESVLLPIALFLDALDHEASAESADKDRLAAASPLQRFLARSRGIFLVATREIRSDLSPAVHAVEVDKPAPAEQAAIWAEALDGAAGESSQRLAGQFNLNADAIRQIVRTAETEASGGKVHDHLWAACLASTSPRMDRLAQRLHPVATWDDIVLPDEEMELLRQLAAQVAQRARVYDHWGFRRRMNRGLGISALFAGESGTGKTMAAEVIANHLRLHLYRIDLSAVVSKYIGETEKNLRKLFDAAEDGGAILFFDEADALFGKRSEVRDSHDRYANIETSYLLQRVESYRGLAILATNMRGALDEAFMRRLRFVITFPFPGPRQREAIWQRAWPSETPVAELDYDRLARLSLAGGNIANIALNAAFLAAEGGTPVTMPLVLDAARTEYQKLERPVNDDDFRWVGQLPPPEGSVSDAVPEAEAIG